MDKEVSNARNLGVNMYKKKTLVKWTEAHSIGWKTKRGDVSELKFFQHIIAKKDRSHQCFGLTLSLVQSLQTFTIFCCPFLSWGSFRFVHAHDNHDGDSKVPSRHCANIENLIELNDDSRSDFTYIVYKAVHDYLHQAIARMCNDNDVDMNSGAMSKIHPNDIMVNMRPNEENMCAGRGERKKMKILAHDIRKIIYWHAANMSCSVWMR